MTGWESAWKRAGARFRHTLSRFSSSASSSSGSAAFLVAFGFFCVHILMQSWESGLNAYFVLLLAFLLWFRLCLLFRLDFFVLVFFVLNAVASCLRVNRIALCRFCSPIGCKV